MPSPSWQRRLESLLGVPATTGNDITILRNGDEIFDAMLGEIRCATRCIDFLTFVYWRGDIAERFAEAFSEQARDGVRVRILLDTIGARLIAPRLIKQMRSAGCDVRWFRPIDTAPTRANRRTHRKVLVCDEVIGFTGGVGIAAEWAGEPGPDSGWRDTHFQVRGPAIDGIHAAFFDNWGETGPLEIDAAFDHFPDRGAPGTSTVQVIRGAAETGSNDIANLLAILIAEAEQQLRITTAYFNPDVKLTGLLMAAAERGVSVEVLVPGLHADKRFVQIIGEANYAALLDAGVVIRGYDRTMLHAKILTVDQSVATVGSANINQRSMQFDEELNLVLFDEQLVAELDADFDDDLQFSTVIDPDEWAERSRLQRAAERAASVIGDLF